MTTDSSSTPSRTSRWPSASPSARRRPEAAPAGVSVNLLPRELAERIRARRVTRYTVGAVAVLMAVLAVAYVHRLVEVGRAEQARDAAQAEVVALESELAQLAEYRQLAEAMETRNTLLASAMEREIAFSEVLNDLSLTFPANASLRSLRIVAHEREVQAGPGEITFGDSIADAQYSGYSVERYAPGVETMLVDFDRADGFFNTFLTTASRATIADTEVTDFAGTVDLDRTAYTGRYADGLPPEATP